MRPLLRLFLFSLGLTAGPQLHLELAASGPRRPGGSGQEPPTEWGIEAPCWRVQGEEGEEGSGKGGVGQAPPCRKKCGAPRARVPRGLHLRGRGRRGPQLAEWAPRGGVSSPGGIGGSRKGAIGFWGCQRRPLINCREARGASGREVPGGLRASDGGVAGELG